MRSKRSILSAFRCVAAGFIWMGMLAGARVASAQQTLHVCAIDARFGWTITGADVRVVTPATTYEAETGADGCAHISGSIPVSSEEYAERPDRPSSTEPYPNPAGRRVAIPVEVGAGEFLEIQMYDIQGRAVQAPVERHLETEPRHFVVDLSSLADGMYVYRISGASGWATGRLIKMEHAASHYRAAALDASGGRGGQKPRQRLFAGAGVDSVQVEVSAGGFVDAEEKRVVRNGEVVKVTLFKITNQGIPLIDMGGYLYLGRYEGGLYPDQQNEMPIAHFVAGLELARSIKPLDREGRPDPNGGIIFTSIGMSTTSSVFCGVSDPNDPCKAGAFMEIAQNEAGINSRLVLIDGADPGKTADEWEDPELRAFQRIEDEELKPFGYTDQQVQVAWVKLASSQPDVSLPDANADAYKLKRQIGNAMRALRSRFPNLKLVFFSSRVYGGYAVTDINPEPYAYENGYAVKWVIEAQFRQMYEDGALVDPAAGNLDYRTAAPWLAWGPYYWADGEQPRSDGLVWRESDLKDDGTHLARPGVEKIAAMLLDFFKSSPHTRCWFLENGVCE